jgi:hypothetical protein
MAVYKDRYLYAQGDFSRPRPGFSALFAVDTQDARNPRLVAVIPGINRAYGMVVVDHYLYTSGGDIFDLSDPEKPRRLDIRLPCSGYQIAYREPYLFVANFAGEGEGEAQQGTLYVVDISQRENPKLVGKLLLPLGHRVITMAFLGKHLFLGWAQRSGGRRPSGLLVAVDISEPTKPRIANQWDVSKDLGFNETITQIGQQVGQLANCLDYDRRTGHDLSGLLGQGNGVAIPTLNCCVSLGFHPCKTTHSSEWSFTNWINSSR